MGLHRHSLPLSLARHPCITVCLLCNCSSHVTLSSHARYSCLPRIPREGTKIHCLRSFVHHRLFTAPLGAPSLARLALLYSATVLVVAHSIALVAALGYNIHNRGIAVLHPCPFRLHPLLSLALLALRLPCSLSTQALGGVHGTCLASCSMSASDLAFLYPCFHRHLFA